MAREEASLTLLRELEMETAGNGPGQGGSVEGNAGSAGGAGLGAGGAGGKGGGKNASKKAKTSAVDKAREKREKEEAERKVREGGRACLYKHYTRSGTTVVSKSQGNDVELAGVTCSIRTHLTVHLEVNQFPFRVGHASVII
jgi:hypothetical protein